MSIYYGKQTEQAILSYGIGQTPDKLIKAYAEVKKASINAIRKVSSKLSDDKYNSIIDAINQVIDGSLNSNFPLDLKQGGAGTSINMNMNEVIANRSSELLLQKGIKNNLVDPIEDVNRYQSTNDTFPTAVTIVAFRDLLKVEEAVISLQRVLSDHEHKYESVVITGRTQLQDALPMTLAHQFSSWAGAIERDRWRLHKMKERLRTIALGGTAIGTCYLAPNKYIFEAEKELREITKLPLCRNQNLPDEISNLDKFAELSSAYSILAGNLTKISRDLILYCSNRFGEIKHPTKQYGSSIMPIKSNPVILEYVIGNSIRVKNEAGLVNEYSSSGNFQLNPMLPFVADSIFNSAELLVSAITSFINNFFAEMEIDQGRIMKNLLSSNAVMNGLRSSFKYDDLKKAENSMKEKSFSSMSELINILSEAGLDKKALQRFSNELAFTNNINFKE